jgi:endonuclease I
MVIMKRLFSSLIALSFLSISACSNPSQDMGLFQDGFGQVDQISSFAKPRRNDINTDWFSGLKPELQAYYAPARGKTGAELFDALHKIVSQNQKVNDYLTAKSYLYSTADNTVFNGKKGLFDIYSYIFVPGSGGNGATYKENGDTNRDGAPNDFINCEHTWPQSFFNKQLPMVADMHHMFPSMSVPNNMRGHFPFGKVNPETVVYSTSGGSKLGVIDKTGKNRSIAELRKIINLPYEQKSVIMDKELDSVFEPGDQQKGNTSRALLYFYLRYFDQNIKSGEFDENNFWDSRVSTFVQWSEEVDPVDPQEVKRHEIVFKNQGNRNPFIDIPHLASIIGEDVLRAK